MEAAGGFETTLKILKVLKADAEYCNSTWAGTLMSPSNTVGGRTVCLEEAQVWRGTDED